MLEEKRNKLVEFLKIEARIKTKKVEKAFLKIPRENFISKPMKNFAYVDTPLEIGNNQTISAPHMVAIMCEELDLKENQTVLEIGTGSGYHAAIVSHIIGEKGHVYSVERIPELAIKSKENLKKSEIKNVTVEIGDGSEGLPKHSPYDRIYVTCAAPDIPQPLVDQLSDPGKMLIPVGRGFCQLKLIIKENGVINIKNLGGCSFVLLIGKHGF
jgi:protein-L-isoaspartate(D-aspartate) O-methyltransferase